MPDRNRPVKAPNGRLGRPLRAGCAIGLALAAITHASDAPAQITAPPPAFQGTPSVVAGDASVVRGGPSGAFTAVDTVTVRTTTAVIDWSPFDAKGAGTIDFLPATTAGVFRGVGPYTVLNRILPVDPARGIALNGTITAQNVASGAIDGNVWFYSPGGIIIGSTARIDVGSLLLTANDIAFTPNTPDLFDGSITFGPGGEIQLRGAANGTSAVEVQAGAQISASNQGSYIAMVAPRVVQRGTVDVNGSAAYVAAEAVDIRINQGLFDINVITGTSVASAIEHGGATTSPAPAPGPGVPDSQRIFMVAVPKNDAITMLVGGTLGSAATGVAVDNGTVVLSAGYDMQSGAPAGTPENGTAANITITSGTFTSNVLAQATGAVTVSPAPNAALDFEGSATINTAGEARFAFAGTSTFAVAGALQVDAQGNIDVQHSGQTGTPANSISAGNASFSTRGNFASDAASVIRAGANLAIAATGDVTTSGSVIAASNIAIDSGASIAAAAADAGNVLSITAGNRADFSGLASGRTIAVGSGDIGIAAGGQLGTAGRTTRVDLTNTDSSRQTFVGGADTVSGYSLSGAELGRIFTNDITITAPRVALQTAVSVGSSRAPDVIVDGFTLASRAGATSGNLGAQGTLRIATPGKLRVTGAVQLTGLGAGNHFEIAADEALEIDAATGSIDLRDASGGLAGTLALASDDVIAASLSAIADVGAAATTDAIDDRLAVNDGSVNDEGYLRAGAMEVTIRNGFYVQNSGAADGFNDRRGFTVGTGGLSISTTGSAPRIVINGRQANGSGGFVTGGDLIDRVSINGQTGSAITGIDGGSTINGCPVANLTRCAFFIPETPLSRDIFEGAINPADPQERFNRLFPLTLIELKDFEPFGFEPLIDEPVTGAGNDDLWMPECDPDEAECEPPAQE